MRLVVVPKGRRYTMVGRCGWTQAEKNGGPVLKIEASWKKINGFFINTNKGCFWFFFRRYHV